MFKKYPVYQTIVFSFFISVSLIAQVTNENANTILKKASEKFKNDTYYSYNTKYTMYYDYESNDVKESYAGFLLKKNAIYYFKIKNTEFVSFKDYSVKVSGDEDAILITKSDTQELPLDFNNYLNSFKSRLIGTSKSEYICELVPAQVSQIMFSKIVIHVNKQDYSIIKQKLYFLNTIENKNKIASPRLEISFSPRIKKMEADNFLVNEKNYFTRIGNDLKVVTRFKGYKLFKI